MTQSVVAGIVTRRQLSPDHTYWRYREVGSPAFDCDVFDEQKLAALHLLDGVARAGRGNTSFFSLQGQEMVLRHYRRGGMARRVSKDRYFFTSLERTRAMQEFSILLELQKRGLRAPPPYACRVIKHGACYSASLVTYRLPGHTLAECLANNAVNFAQWESIGNAIGQFHREGLFHADLNAHNIMVDSLGRIALIDFDRATFRTSKLSNPTGGWRRLNIKRLHRSLKKVAIQGVTNAADLPPDLGDSKDSELAIGYEDGYKILLASWEAQLEK